MLHHFLVYGGLLAYGYGIRAWSTSVPMFSNHQRGYHLRQFLVSLVWPTVLVFILVVGTTIQIRETLDMWRWRKQQMVRYGAKSWREYLTIVDNLDE